MATESADVTAAHESSDTAEECTGKKKSRFQTFKNLFAKKKRKDAAVLVVDSEPQLKSSHFSEDVSTPKLSPIHIDKDSDDGSKIDIGDEALSHDSVFTSESLSSETNEGLQVSQDSNHGKVKSLQLQLKQAIRLGSPTALKSMKKSEDCGILSEDDGLPCSPPEYTTLHTVLTSSSQRSSGVVQKSSSLSLEGSDSDDDQMSGASSRPDTPQVLMPVDFSQPASSQSCLDNSAAHHRISVKTKACAKRKPASRETRTQDLREKVLLRDTDKLIASRTSTEEEISKAHDSVDVELMYGAKEESARSSLASAENEEQLSASLRIPKASAETFTEETCDHDKDHVGNLAIPESTWDSPVTLELETDDFLLDTGCEVVSEEPGSLLMEVLSSLKGPLTSGLILESTVMIEQRKVEEIPHVDTDIKHKDADDVAEELENDGTTDLPDLLCPSSVLEEEIILVPNPISESVVDQPDQQELEKLEDLQYALEKEEEPEQHDFPTEEPLEDLQVHNDEDELEEDQEEREDFEMEVNEEIEILENVDDVGQVEEERIVEEKLDLEVQETEYCADKEADQEEDFVVECKAEYKDASETVEQEEADDEEDEEELNESDDQTSTLEDHEEQKIQLDKSSDDESCELSQSIEDSALVSSEVLNQPVVLSPQEEIEQPSFVVTTSLDLSIPKISTPTIQLEDELESLPDKANEKMQGYEGCLQLHHEHETEKILTEDQTTTTDNQMDSTVDAHFQLPLSIETHQDPKQEVLPSQAEDEPPNSDHLLDLMRTEPFTTPESQGEQLIPVHKEISQGSEGPTPENPFGVRLRKTPIPHRYASEGETSAPSTQTESEETQKTLFLEQIVRKPAVFKKPDQLGDGVVKPRRTSDHTGGRASPETSEAPSWISLAKQKQKIFKENSMDESSQEESPKKDLLPDISSSVTKENLKPVASPVKVACSLEISKPALGEKDKRSHPAPAPLTQDEPPWLALAKKKAKAWSEMPQIVQ